MKKTIYTLAFLVLIVFSFSSCTKEEVKPVDGAGEGHVIDKGF
jgi:hypothetical protein